ncbi:MATE family efflux transporter [Vibrio viridaestus]|uniref:Multidrug resistance protein NorM n=1 Tax=Vibrio viridaestus TaxID=2487322 RepID=A0A3N9TH29_9VIBR|nr:MATE family efflux transporter [Vibrio viridaestus]RQW63597.1 MATE family efflux transporter [Vibrio viridaestus]
MSNYKNEANNLVRLATPVLIASVAQTGMGFVDTIMAGGYSAVDMAAVSVAASIWLPTILFSMGVLMALIPVVAQLSGARRIESIPFEIQQGIYTALILTLPTGLVLYQSHYILQLMDVEPQLELKTVHYLYAMIFAAPAFLLFQSLRSFTDGISRTKPAMFIGFVGLLCNIPLNWIFVYGKFGMPELGGVGCGIATALVYWLMAALLLFYILKAHAVRHYQIFQKWHPINLKEVWKLFKLGLPVASAQFFEVTLFAAVALLISPLGPTIVAAHQIAINFSTLIFMLPMSIGVAVTIRVGHFLGEGRNEDAQIATKTALFVAIGTALITASFTMLGSGIIARMYTSNQEVLDLAVSLLIVAGVYQCTDAFQATAAGALRGYKDMRAIFIRTLVSYWGVGLPVGYILGMTNWVISPMGAKGFWIGFIAGLSTAAVLLGLRLKVIFKLFKKVPNTQTT